MFFINQEYFSQLEIKKSKFLSYLVPYTLFQSKIDLLKAEHPKARHFVYAYRYLNELDQIVENQTDDGEPKGSSGPPTLKVLRGHNLINVAIITVRYFGGIKLGVGGLVRAYSESCNQVLDKSVLHEYKKLTLVALKTSYGNLSKCLHLLEKQYSVTFVNKNFAGDYVGIEFKIEDSEVLNLKKHLTELQLIL